MKRNIILLSMLSFFLSSYGQKGLFFEPIGFLSDKSDNNDARVWITQKAKGKVEIPEWTEINGHKCHVVAVGDYYQLDTNKKYQDNLKVEEIVLPNSISVIGCDVFNGFNNLVRINIPSSVKLIGYGAFSQDRRGSDLEVHITDFDSFCKINSKSSPFGGSGHSHGTLFLNGKEVKHLVLPDWMKETPQHLFSGICIDHITIPEGITKISSHSFTSIKGLTEIILPQTIQKIEEYALCSNDNIEKITLPNNPYLTIGCYALGGCENLLELVVPDYCDDRNISSYSTSTPISERKYSNPFLQYCKKITRVTGYSVRNPSWIFPYMPSDCPAAKQIKTIQDSYSYQVENNVYRKMLQWQESWKEKKEFETTEQWKKRIQDIGSPASVKTKQDELIKECHNKYMKEHTPSSQNCSLGMYDADNRSFPVTLSGSNTIYVTVPLNEATAFKQKFTSDAIKVSYGIVNDRVAPVNFRCELKGKKYKVTTSQIKDESRDIALQLPPLRLEFDSDNNVENSHMDGRNRQTLWSAYSR